MIRPLAQRAVAEFFGTALLVGAVIGSGVMAERLSGGNTALALLANTLATGAALIALILTFGPISGAHLNPVVTTLAAWGRAFPWVDVIPYVLSQVAGGIGGALLAHLMFGLRLVSLSQHARSGPAQILSELVATFGLVCVIHGTARSRPGAVAVAVGAYITSAYWFTASTSFANPAVTIARSISDTFAGIRPTDVLGFVLAQFAGGTCAAVLFRWLLGSQGQTATASTGENR